MPGSSPPADRPPEEDGQGRTAVVEAEPEKLAPKHRAPKEEDHGGFLGFFRELPGLIVIAFLLALLIKSFLVQAFFIPSQSMVPTLKVGDRVLVNKLVYDFGEPEQGDIIVFEDPHGEDVQRNPLSAVWNWLIEGLGFNAGIEQDFIKRVIGTPNDVIEMTKGEVTVNGEPIEEPYLQRAGNADFGPFTVPEDNVFVMGDNRPNSSDSRTVLGPIPYEKIVGKAFVLLWPPSRMEWLGNND
ncbi:MAG: signal peptidase I [Actinomycetota bacterium]|nr:signal peptidase I [Actinomycetota bacterium]